MPTVRPCRATHQCTLKKRQTTMPLFDLIDDGVVLLPTELKSDPKEKLMTIYVGIGELAASGEPGTVIKTLALGSCVAVAIFSKKQPVAGLIHVQLPESSINKELAAKRPGAFADVGIPLLLAEMEKLGCKPADMVVKLAGGAQVMDPNSTFNIGKRNYLAVKKALWANRLFPASEEVGGEISRTVTLTVGANDLLIHTPGYENRKI